MMFDEMMTGKEELPREPYKNLASWLSEQDHRKLLKKSALAEKIFRRIGITFNVYGDRTSKNA